jgi:hypothetical protein
MAGISGIVRASAYSNLTNYVFTEDEVDQLLEVTKWICVRAREDLANYCFEVTSLVIVEQQLKII